MGRPVPVADKAVAQAALSSLLTDEYDASYSEFLVDTASRVRFQPSTRQLVLTFDLAMGSDTPE